MRLLIVEDEKQICDAIAKSLYDAGYEVDTCYDGEEALEYILAENYDYIVIDGEAGIEQINRRVMEKVTHLMLITDSSKKGTQVVKTIKQVADELVMYDKVGVIANRLPNLDVKQYMDVGDIPVLSYILSDASLAEFDLKGESVFYLDDDAAIVRGAKEALIGIGILEA